MIDIKLKGKINEAPVEQLTSTITEVPEEQPTSTITEVPVLDTKEDTSKIDQTKQNQQKKLRQRRIRRVILVLLGATIFFMLTTMYSQYQVYVLKKLEAINEANHPDVPTTPNQILEAVSHHIVLPDGTPQIATVQDAKKLSTSQNFFKDAINGDVVLVYDGTIILYRPTQDILVAVGDVTAGGKK